MGPYWCGFRAVSVRYSCVGLPHRRYLLSFSQLRQFHQANGPSHSHETGLINSKACDCKVSSRDHERRSHHPKFINLYRDDNIVPVLIRKDEKEGIRMMRLFGGMIIGSMMTMVLLGGPTAANQILANARSTFHEQYAQPDPSMTMVFLVSLGLTLACIAVWRTKQQRQTATVVNKLRRFCS